MLEMFIFIAVVFGLFIIMLGIIFEKKPIDPSMDLRIAQKLSDNEIDKLKRMRGEE